MSIQRVRSLRMLGCLLIFAQLCGCSGLRHWRENNFRVGPNYCTPNARVAEDFRDFDEPKVDASRVLDPEWWHVFQDPQLDSLIQQVYSQNLSLKAAAWRIQEARSIRRIAGANLLPQSQTAFGQYAHTQNSLNAANAFPGFPLTIDDWSTGLDVGWELDVWGRIRRSIDASEAQIASAVKDYDFAVITLIGDVASIYIQIRSLDERLELARQNVQLQVGSLDVATIRFEEGRTDKLDVVQAQSNLAATKALIPQLELARRQSSNALAILLGEPPSTFPELAPGKLPTVPAEVVVGIPAQLVQRRPDIQSAERLMAAQFEQIGIVEADLYPTFTLGGSLGLQSARFSNLFNGRSFTGTIAPSFRWNILNYGRLREAINVEWARFQQIQWNFQNSVLLAQGEAEDGIAEFIKTTEQYQSIEQQVAANVESVELAQALYREGKQDFGRVFVVESGLVQAQDQLVATKANIALALIKTYKALGGGWEIRCFGGPNAIGSEMEIESGVDQTYLDDVPPMQMLPVQSAPAPFSSNLNETIDDDQIQSFLNIANPIELDYSQ